MALESFKALLMIYIPNMIYALGIVVVGYVFAAIVRKIVHKAMSTIKNDTMKSFIPTCIYVAIMVVVVIAALSALGVPTASLLTLLGAASLAIGFALKDFLANIAASFVIIFLRPFKVGDYIITGNAEGVVTDINLFMTKLTSLGNEAEFIPNSKIVSDRIANKTFFQQRRMEIAIGISYSADMSQARQIILDVVASDPMILADPSPQVLVKDLADSAVILGVRLWVHKNDFAQAKFNTIEKIKREFDANNIEIPFPQLEVRLIADG